MGLTSHVEVHGLKRMVLTELGCAYEVNGNGARHDHVPGRRACERQAQEDTERPLAVGVLSLEFLPCVEACWL